VSDHRDDAVQDAAVGDVTSSEAQVEHDVEDSATIDVVPRALADATVSTPTPTVEMKISRTGEYRLSKRERWLRSLNRAIAEHPEAPTNYVLRGELALEIKAYDQAISDFKKALELASIQVETSNWGIVAQVMQDRAQLGLSEAKRKAANHRK
jgi:tetratricopeptide (TPR) repeat protein